MSATLSHPAAVTARLEEINADLAERQNDLEGYALAWYRLKREKEKKRAEVFLASEETVAERSARADAETALIGREEEAAYEALKAVVRVLNTRAEGGRMTRAEKVAMAQRLRAEGLSVREIAERMGTRRGTVSTWLADPDLSKQRARREGYRGRCEDCGAPTDGSNGPGGAPPFCLRCAPIHSGEARKFWTEERILQAIHEWADLYGEPPATWDWSPYSARCVIHDEARAARWERQERPWPSFVTVVKHFGSWNAAIRAAGFQPREPHGGGGNVARRRSQKVSA